MKCVQCSDELIAPEKSEYCSDKRIYHVWRCLNCHCCFESLVLRAAETANERHQVKGRYFLVAACRRQSFGSSRSHDRRSPVAGNGRSHDYRSPAARGHSHAGPGLECASRRRRSGALRHGASPSTSPSCGVAETAAVLRGLVVSQQTIVAVANNLGRGRRDPCCRAALAAWSVALAMTRQAVALAFRRGLRPVHIQYF
jgi:hypothetical protein